MLIGCSKPKTAVEKYEKVLEHFKNDELKYKAAKFLIENIGDKYAIIKVFEDSSGKDISNKLRGFRGGETQEFLDSIKATSASVVLPDSQVVSPDYLIKSIEEAFKNYNNNPLKIKVPFATFCNFILPHRVGFEKVNDWRTYFNTRYTNYLKTFNKNKINDQFLISIFRQEQYIWYNYGAKFGLAAFIPSYNQTIETILELKSPNNCEDIAVFYLYLYRSLGIPAAYEVIPFFGKFNAGHAETAIMNKNGKFQPASLDDDPFKYQIAKMYRRIYEKVPNPYVLIKEAGEDPYNIPEYFNSDHLVDITNERTIVSDITIPISTLNKKNKVAYLCVYNWGQWKPVAWAKLDRVNSTLTFKNMGRKILYQLVKIENGIKLINSPFILDTLGTTISFNGSNKYRSITVSKFDRKIDITPKRVYVIKYWNETLSDWKIIKKEVAVSGSMVFHRIPENILLKIEEEGYTGDPVRPFTISASGEQIWW